MFNITVAGKVVNTGIQSVYCNLNLSKCVRNGFQERKNVSIWVVRSFSICIMDSISVTHAWKKGGVGDFHSLNISLLATIIPSSNGCRIVVGIVLVAWEQPKMASPASGWRCLLYALEYQSNILDQKFVNEEQVQKAWNSVPSVTSHLSHIGETDGYILCNLTLE